jgi:ABC-type uncharacterized transport system substrate-binding protein
MRRAAAYVDKIVTATNPGDLPIEQTTQYLLAVNLTAAAALVRAKVELIFTVGPAALRAAANATRTIRIVAHDLETDPVKAKLAVSLAGPGRNMSGHFLDSAELAGKWLEMLREVSPRMTRIAILWDPARGPYQLAAVADTQRRAAWRPANPAAHPLHAGRQSADGRSAEDRHPRVHPAAGR